jgi:catechol 2,3-dioxygenase-like lactoylglutathione lyase family enzyme
MQRHLAHLTLVIDDYDTAIEYYTRTLGFVLLEDTPLAPPKRWVRVAPSATHHEAMGCSLLLAQAANDEQRNHIGNQTGGRVFLFLHTDDFWRDYRAYVAAGVTFVRPPSVEVYGTVAVFSDRYGNLWDLIGPTADDTAA